MVAPARRPDDLQHAARGLCALHDHEPHHSPPRPTVHLSAAQRYSGAGAVWALGRRRRVGGRLPAGTGQVGCAEPGLVRRSLAFERALCYLRCGGIPMTTKRIAVVLTLIAAISVLISCSSGPSAPETGTPAFYWQRVREVYAAGDYMKTLQHLDN